MENESQSFFKNMTESNEFENNRMSNKMRVSLKWHYVKIFNIEMQKKKPNETMKTEQMHQNNMK